MKNSWYCEVCFRKNKGIRVCANCRSTEREKSWQSPWYMHEVDNDVVNKCDDGVYRQTRRQNHLEYTDNNEIEGPIYLHMLSCKI